MNRTLNDPPFPTSLLAPPYEHLQRVSRIAPSTVAALPAGTIAVVHVRSCPADVAGLADWIPVLRAQLPTVPVVLQLDTASTKDLLHLAGRVSGLHVRALLAPGEPLAESLRGSLTNPDDVPAHIVEWLTLRGVSCGPVLAHLVQQIFTLGGRHAEVADLLRAIGEPETSARFRFRKRGLPSPRRWLQAVRALRIAMRIQAEPRLSLAHIALELGYGDHSALSQAVMRSFRVRPGRLRGTLGWEWLLDRWLTAERADRAAPSQARAA